MKLLRLLAASCVLLASPLSAAIPWGEINRQPAEWYATPEARAIADSILTYQTPSGGWQKNTDMTAAFPEAERIARDAHPDASKTAATIDNGATTTQVRYLASVASASGEKTYQDAFFRGFDYLLDAQYPNGGWPQFFPLRKGYYSHITFNDDATRNVLEIVRDVAAGKAPYAFVDEPRRIRAADALTRGIDCVLRCQIVVDGKRTVWAAQHDETTFAPAAARKFEPACFTAQESAGLVRFLMSLENPSPEIIASVQGAVVWFERTKITGVRFDRIKTPEGRDGVVTADPAAPPIWARFYELGTERPIFIGRDEVIHYALSEIERERRGGYAWYDDRPADILKKYPSWAARNKVR